MAEKYWLGTVNKCDICGTDFTGPDKQTEFVDGVTKWGPWANMCMSCHSRDGRGIGPGKGQHYKIQPDGRWLKVGG